jgi:hypothetical protein
MSSEEDEAACCLTKNNSLERYTHSIPWRDVGGQSSQCLWLFIQLLIEQEALAMSSEEDEAVCLTNNSL